MAALRGVHPDLIKVVQSCAADSPMPFTFGVTCGLRTHREQKLTVASGASRTMNSRHLDGHAVDLVTLVTGEAKWDWPLYYTLADAMREAALRCRIPLIWGGCWDREMSDWKSPAPKESADYVQRWYAAHPNHDGGPLMDGPHFELPRSKYISGAYTPGIKTA